MHIKNLICFPLDIRRAQKLLAMTSQSPLSLAQRPIALDLHATAMMIDSGRHLAAITHHAQAIGSPLLIRCRRELLALMARKTYGRSTLASATTTWLAHDTAIPNDALQLTDECREESLAVQLLIGRDVVPGAAVMPYPMHPDVLPHAAEDSLSRLRLAPSRRSVFFAGNQKAKYDNAQIKSNFGVMSRPEVVRTIHENFGDRIAQALAGNDATTQIVLHDTQVARITIADWLPTLARHSFFLCAPGSSQPICHNVVEAMSVGTIPIIEYGGRLTPPLLDGMNAIEFQGSEGLCQAIERIDALSNHQISILRDNVISYYENHLRSDRFLTHLRDHATGIRRVSMPFHHTNLYDQSVRPAGTGIASERRSSAA